MCELARASESTGAQHVAALVHAELGFTLARDCIVLATLPAIMFGAELCAHLPAFEKTLNKAQENLARKLLGITGPAPRAVILHEMGWESRWSTLYRARAAMLWTRLTTDSRYSEAARVCAVAADHPALGVLGRPRGSASIASRALATQPPRSVALRAPA